MAFTKIAIHSIFFLSLKVRSAWFANCKIQLITIYQIFLVNLGLFPLEQRLGRTPCFSMNSILLRFD